MISPDLRTGFIIANLCLISFGILCFLGPVRRGWATAELVIWFWIILETINGLGHPIWSLYQRHYTPGTFTAPVLLGLALYLARQLLRVTDPSPAR